MTHSDTHRTIDAVWRIESARLIAGLARFVHDIGLAEDLAQDALVIALNQWPTTGIPDSLQLGTSLKLSEDDNKHCAKRVPSVIMR